MYRTSKPTDRLNGQFIIYFQGFSGIFRDFHKLCYFLDMWKCQGFSGIFGDFFLISDLTELNSEHILSITYAPEGRATAEGG